MKKILSVALSTAMAFSMFASVAFGADAKLTPEQQFNTLKEAGIVSGFPDGLSHLEKTLTRAELAKIIVNSLSLEPVDATSYNDKNYANHWGRTYIEAATQAGILNGKDAAKKLFDPNGAVTVQELAKVLVTALKLEVPADANNTASAWAKGYVAAAVNAGYLADGINYQAQATRSQAVVAAYAIYEAAQVPTVKSYKVVDSKNVEFTLSNDEVVKVTLEKALEANKETEVTFKTAAGEEIKTSVTWVLTTATKVEKVTADNLKQVVVTFDGEVEKATAEDANNYSINGKVINSASLSSDKKAVTLTLDTTGANLPFSNQVEYKLTFNNVKAGDKVLSVTDYKFTPVDATLPTATGVQALGNQTVKITFSEPIKTANSNSFTVDGSTAIGYTKISGNTVIVKLYSKLATGDHKLTVNAVEDYASFKSLSQSFDFAVVEDSTAPTATVESATFESVRVKFSEPVDDATVLAANVYWNEGTTKRYPNTAVKMISDDTYEFDFSNYPIRYATDLIINGVKDYSGNVIATDTKVQVNPVVDQVRPEVVNVTVNNSKSITVKFSKVLEPTAATKSANYVIKDADGKVVSNLKTISQPADKKVVDIALVQALTEGKTYTLEISGVTDNTTLKNAILPYTTSITIKDSGNPTIVASGVVRNTANNSVAITFSEQVAVSGDGNAVDKAKYFYKASGSADWKTLPDGASINISPDGKSVILYFPTGVNGVNVANVTDIRVQLVKDLAGNYISGLTSDQSVITVAAADLGVDKIEASATNKIDVYFKSALLSSSVNLGDFDVRANGTPLSVLKAELTDTKKVTLTLADGDKLGDNALRGTYGVTVAINANATTSTPSGLPISAAAAAPVVDKIAASIDKIVGSADGTTMTIKFNEALTAIVTPGTNEAGDLVIKDKDGNTLTPGTDYTVAATGTATPATANDLVVTFTTAKTGVVKVSMPSVRYIKDAATPTANNVAVVAVNDAIEVDVDNAAPTVLAGAAGAGTNSVTTLVLTASEDLDVADLASVLAKLDGAQVGKINTAVYTVATKTITITFKTAGDAPVTGDVISTTNFTDLDGNSLVNQKFTFDGTIWVQAAK